MKVLTIAGKAEAGKDTTAKKIKNKLEHMGYAVLICHYADLLKYICTQFFNWDGKKDERGRELLQMIGTEGVRNKEPDYWVDFIKSILRLFPNKWDFVLIPDCRFPNEIVGMKEEFDTIAVRINRPNYENHLTDEQRQHLSEVALDDFEFDYEIINPGSMDGLDNEVEDFIYQLFQDEKKKSIIEKIKESL